MNDLAGRGKAKEASIHAVITRADGTVEDLGVVSYWHRNPLKRWLFRAKNRRAGLAVPEATHRAELSE